MHMYAPVISHVYVPPSVMKIPVDLIRETLSVNIEVVVVVCRLVGSRGW